MASGGCEHGADEFCFALGVSVSVALELEPVVRWAMQSG